MDGIAPAELLQLQRLGAHTLCPRAQGRSLELLLLVHGDSTARYALAATTRWAREVWLAGVQGPRAVQGNCTLPELRGCWDAAWPKQKVTWRTAKGPIAIMALELLRVSWTMRHAFRLVPGEGEDVCLVTTPPADIARLLAAAHHRALARTAAEKLAKAAGEEWDGIDRVGFDVLRRLATTSCVKPLDKAVALTAVCGAVCTQTELRRRGVLVDERCKLCMNAPDTLHHRLWVCPAADQQRQALGMDGVVQETMQAGPGNLLFSRGILLEPRGLPAPLALEVASVQVQVQGNGRPQQCRMLWTTPSVRYSWMALPARPFSSRDPGRAGVRNA